MILENISLTRQQINRAFASTDRLIRSHSKTFYFATGLLPPRKRSAIRSLYAFCRATDDLVDQERATQADVEAWRRKVNRPISDQDEPALLTWSLVREQYGVDRHYEKELIDGVAMDIQVRQYATWADLEKYCYHVASTVGLLSMPIIGLAPGVTFSQAEPFAIQLGIALQLTNILRDVGEDARRGRVYLSLSDLAAHGLTAADIYRGVHDDRFKGLMKFEIERARSYYSQALPGIAMLSRSARPAVGAAALLYRAILNEIEAIDYRVHNQRAFTSIWRKVQMLPGILLTVMRLRTPKLSPEL
jgi:15-cis-phytoene synthase